MGGERSGEGQAWGGDGMEVGWGLGRRPRLFDRSLRGKHVLMQKSTKHTENICHWVLDFQTAWRGVKCPIEEESLERHTG